MRPDAAIVLLAAGGSSRMGRPKQLLDVGTTAMLRHSAEQALASAAGMVVIVTGSEREAVEDVVKGLAVRCVHHAGWEQGIASSIRVGITAVRQGPAIQDIVIAVGDQPEMTGVHLAALIKARRRSGSGMAASAYAGTLGVPCSFGPAYFDRLETLDGEGGAKALLREFPHDLCKVDFPGGEFDLDTPEDYKRWRKAKAC